MPSEPREDLLPDHSERVDWLYAEGKHFRAWLLEVYVNFKGRRRDGLAVSQRLCACNQPGDYCHCGGRAASDEEQEDPHLWCGFAPDHDGPCPVHPDEPHGPCECGSPAPREEER